jgi:hypothetical protein
MQTESSDVRDSRPLPSNEVIEAAKEHEVSPLFKTAQAGEGVSAEELRGTGFTYRHDWGSRHGQWKLTLNWGAINCNSRVFVSICEFGGGAQCGFVGSARYTVHNVAPFNGGVTVWINIEYNSDIRVHFDYLVVNP